MSAFENVEFPEKIAYASRFGPSFNVSIITNDSGQEVRTARRTQARRMIDVSYGIKSVDDLNEVLRFYMAMGGPVTGFLFKDPSDFWSSIQGRKSESDAGEPSFNGTVLEAPDGSRTEFSMVKPYSVGTLTHQRRILKPFNTGLGNASIEVEVAGVAKTATTDYIIDFDNGKIRFQSGAIPTAGQAILWSGQYRVPVRFGKLTDDLLSFVWSGFDNGELGPVPLIEILDPGPLNGWIVSGGYREIDLDTFGDAILDPASGMFVVLANDTVGRKVVLSDPTILPGGGPYFTIALDAGATQNVLVRDESDTTTLATLTPGDIVQCFIAEPSGGGNAWYVF